MTEIKIPMNFYDHQGEMIESVLFSLNLKLKKTTNKFYKIDKTAKML